MPQSNQPLADIYFLIVLETHIGNENLSTASLKKEIEKVCIKAIVIDNLC